MKASRVVLSLATAVLGLGSIHASVLVEIARFSSDMKMIKPGYESEYMKPIAEAVDGAVRAWLEDVLKAEREGRLPYRIVREKTVREGEERMEPHFAVRVAIVDKKNIGEDGRYSPESRRVVAAGRFVGIPAQDYKYGISNAIGLFDRGIPVEYKPEGTDKTILRVSSLRAFQEAFSELLFDNAAALLSEDELLDLGYIVIYPMLKVLDNGSSQFIQPWELFYELKVAVRHNSSGEEEYIFYAAEAGNQL